jgi:superfamily II DNA/RNA helicase
VIFNLNIPQNPMDYLHRAGRTGRNNTEGLSVLIITPEELPKIKEIQKEFKIEIEERKIFNGKIS